MQNELPTLSEIYVLDLTDPQACMELHNAVKGKGLDILVNNAGMGVYGEYHETNLEAEIAQIDLNIRALGILTKLFLADFIAADHGAILNVASLAAFVPGPLMAGYYASKSYVLRLSQAIYEELRQRGSKVSISVLCPGPVRTSFNQRAGVDEGVPGMASADVAAYAVKMMFKRKLVIIPGFLMRLTRWGQSLLPTKLLLRVLYRLQLLKKVSV